VHSFAGPWDRSIPMLRAAVWNAPWRGGGAIWTLVQSSDSQSIVSAHINQPPDTHRAGALSGSIRIAAAVAYGPLGQIDPARPYIRMNAAESGAAAACCEWPPLRAVIARDVDGTVSSVSHRHHRRRLRGQAGRGTRNAPAGGSDRGRRLPCRLGAELCRCASAGERFQQRSLLDDLGRRGRGQSEAMGHARRDPRRQAQPQHQAADLPVRR